MAESGSDTRSLLSVLSHSSVESLSTGSLTSTNSLESSSKVTGQRAESKAGDQTRDITGSQNGTQNDDGATPSPWETWLIEKTKMEREKIRDDIRKNLAEIKARKEKEERNKEKRRHVEERVLDWLKEKERAEKKKSAVERRKKRQEQADRSNVKQNNAEKDKVKREEWLLQKKQKEQKERERADQEKREKGLEERLRKESAEQSYKKWKRESVNRPTPGHTRESSYPTPTFINPIPWRPIETSTPLSRTKKKKGKKRNQPRM